MQDVDVAEGIAVAGDRVIAVHDQVAMWNCRADRADRLLRERAERRNEEENRKRRQDSTRCPICGTAGLCIGFACGVDGTPRRSLRLAWPALVSASAFIGQSRGLERVGTLLLSRSLASNGGRSGILGMAVRMHVCAGSGYSTKGWIDRPVCA
jgi:hypothetical protein